MSEWVNDGGLRCVFVQWIPLDPHLSAWSRHLSDLACVEYWSTGLTGEETKRVVGATKRRAWDSTGRLHGLRPPGSAGDCKHVGLTHFVALTVRSFATVRSDCALSPDQHQWTFEKTSININKTTMTTTKKSTCKAWFSWHLHCLNLSPRQFFRPIFWPKSATDPSAEK